MTQQSRSEHTRAVILRAALETFSTRGFLGTSIRDIADAAGISSGNLYHQFPDKEEIFQTLLEEFWREVDKPEYPLNQALASGAFPNDIEALGRAARDSVQQFKPYVALIYVDVVEFEGRHIRRFYSEMASRFQAFLDQRPDLVARLRPDVSPLTAIMTATRFLLYYYSVEHVFGVPNHFGKSDDEALTEIARLFTRAVLRDE
jgi:hypothetical protein